MRGTEMSKVLRGGDVTDVLIRSTEKASEDNATHVMVILYTKKEPTGYTLHVDSNDAVTIETANWLCDKVKDWLIRETDD